MGSSTRNFLRENSQYLQRSNSGEIEGQTFQGTKSGNSSRITALQNFFQNLQIFRLLIDL